MARQIQPNTGRSPFSRMPSPFRAWGADPFQSFHQEIDRLFDDFFGSHMSAIEGEGGRAIAPSIDVRETDKGIEICADLPGIEPKDIDIEVNGDMLTIRAERKMDHEETRQNYRVVERSHGSFARSIRMPFSIDPEKVSADYDKGVLTVIVQQPPEIQRKARKIAIQDGGRGVGAPSGPQQGPQATLGPTGTTAAAPSAGPKS